MVFLLKIIGKKLLLLGGLTPQGRAIDSVSRRQSNVPMNEEEQQQPPPPMTIDQFLSSDTKKQDATKWIWSKTTLVYIETTNRL
ncbi:hypothetical protein C8J55DRAFT_528515 [Lentinula edodes]|uniref:Uncharacterized protein n=1 Tax=Lentinula lateritia TaxID=40482 RepID=A0A9W8ZTZ5_9AGAR|nr:hypothetical protein C8J55DRAFT_528515 [Lentinula edodes]